MPRCGSNCDASYTQVSWEPVPGYAKLFNEGTLVSFEITHDDLNFKYSADGKETSRSGKQATMITVTITELPCSDWYKAVYAAWKADKFSCGTLVINDPCCSITVVNFATVEPDIRNIAVDSNDPVNIVFKGLLDKGTSVAQSIGVNNSFF